MENTLILCGGTGAHTSVAFLRLHTLGYALGFFDHGDKHFDFPAIFLVDQDAGDGAEREPTAWQLTRDLVARHPGRRDWTRNLGRNGVPELIQVTPLPVGSNQSWFKRPYNNLATRFEGLNLLELLASDRQQGIDYSKGMMGSPAIGSLLFRLKQYDERSRELNHDETFGQMLESRGRIAIAGSGVGGTGAAVAPTLARTLAGPDTNNVLAVMVLNWFEFEEDEADESIRIRAQHRNRLMRENANSALEFYGQTLARTVATLPVGMPEQSLTRRRYTSDVSQPIYETFVHAVAALASARHFLNPQPYGPGLHMMSAVEPGRLDGTTAIPGGTLQGLANQAGTLVRTLETWREVLNREHGGRVRPGIYSAVARVAQPQQVADYLGQEIDHYRQQIDWLQEVLGVTARVNEAFTREGASRTRLTDGRSRLDLPADTRPEDVAAALFHWTAKWIRESASTQNQLEVHPGRVNGAHWPTLGSTQGLGIAPKTNGDLDRIDDASRDPVLEAFVHAQYLSCNGWPHPLAPVEYFHHAIQRRDPVAFRQLELLLVGLLTGELQIHQVEARDAPATGISLERLFAEYRREEYKGLAEIALVSPRHSGRVVAFNSPFTLLCPVSFMDEEEGDLLWDDLWRRLSGASDGAAWHEAEEPPTWGDNDLAVQQVRAWIEQQRQARPGASPPWAKVFERYQGQDLGSFGAGALLKVYWGSSSDPDRPLVDINLPTREQGEWKPSPNMPSLDESVLLERIPELEEVRDKQGEALFRSVDFEIPGREGQLKGYWDEHLDHLKKIGKIHIWARDDKGTVILGTMEPEGLHATWLNDSRLLSYKTVAIRSCTPLEQDPVPGSRYQSGQVRYPDLPLGSDYLDLVKVEDSSLLRKLKEGALPEIDWQPTVRRDSQGRQLVKWSLDMRGRKLALPIEICLNEDDEPSRAHWMVWPRFRARKPGGWKVYYIYEKSENLQLQLETLWLDESRTKPRVRRQSRPSEDLFAYPVSYRAAGEVSNHDGGPPLAFSLRHQSLEQEQGIYLIPLSNMNETPVRVNLAVDFGTSHSVAAVKVGSDPPRQVELLPELDVNYTPKALTLHISENWAQVEAPPNRSGILATGAWLPTYSTKKDQGFLPSELILYKSLKSAQSDDVEDWIPATHYLIPPLGISREDLAEYVLTDFKWDTGSTYFRGRESELREKYLSLFLELVMADVVKHHIGGIPDQQINLTFTYPLRSRENQVREFQRSLEKTLRQCSQAMGIQFALHDGVGIYDESRAAQLTTKKFGEVCLVGDLGGGTLDLFIAAMGKTDVQLPQVADSARLGGNLLLRQLAAAASRGFLPNNGTWTGSDSRDTETKLRAWMRSAGSAKLFGVDGGGRPRLGKMELYGFDKAAEGERARTLLDRYFRLIVEYMARSLTAYLYVHWYPGVDEEDHDKLSITVQLRGNGWRLRYQDEDHVVATDSVQQQVRERVRQLWQMIDTDRYPNPGEQATWLPPGKYKVDNPKVAPIKSVVGKSMSYDKVKGNWHTHTLVDLSVRRNNGKQSQVDWHSQVPFRTGGSKHVEVGGISPPMVLSSPFDDDRIEVSGLDASHEGQINDALQGDEGVVEREKGTYRAPVAPLVWEAVFESQLFWPGKGDE